MERKKYVTTKYRVRPGVQSLVKYMEWKEVCNDEDHYDKYILDTAVKESLQLLKQGLVQIKRDNYRKRKDRSLTFEINTIQIINEKYKDFKFYKGELIEICLYIYALKHLTNDERDMNGLNSWNIEVIFTNKK